MATLEIRKETNKVWRHVPSDALPYIVSKMYIKSDGDLIRVVEQGGSQRGQYNFADVSVYNIGGVAETFGSAQQLMERLEALNYIGFFYEGEVSPSELISSDVDNAIELGTDGKLFAPISGGAVDSVNGQTGVVVLNATDVSALSNDPTDYTDATTPLAGTEIALVEQGGTFKKVAVSEFGGGGDDTFTLHFQTGNKTWALNTWYQQFSFSGFNISGTTTYGTGSVPTSTVHSNGSWLLIPTNFIIDEITFGIQAVQGTPDQLYSTEVYVTRGELAYERVVNSQDNLEIISQEVVSATISATNPKFYKKLTIASHTPLDLSILQVVMRNTSATTNLTYNVSMAIKFKKA